MLNPPPLIHSLYSYSRQSCYLAEAELISNKSLRPEIYFKRNWTISTLRRQSNKYYQTGVTWNMCYVTFVLNFSFHSLCSILMETQEASCLLLKHTIFWCCVRKKYTIFFVRTSEQLLFFTNFVLFPSFQADVRLSRNPEGGITAWSELYRQFFYLAQFYISSAKDTHQFSLAVW